MSEIDHKLKEVIRSKHYYRYCDDMIVLAKSKIELHIIRKYVALELDKIGLTLKKDYRVHPVVCGIDVLGYIVDTQKVRVRSNIKRNMVRHYTVYSAPRYDGILTHCDGYRLKTKLKRRLNDTIT